jgi:large subunit ribosomal protein L24
MAENTVKYKLRKDDEVEVVAGKNKGKRGKVLSVDRDKGRLVVEGVNMVKKAKRRKTKQERGGIVEFEAPIHISNVNIVCKKCGKTKIAYKIEGDKKIRVCRKCGEVL